MSFLWRLLPTKSKKKADEGESKQFKLKDDLSGNTDDESTQSEDKPDMSAPGNQNTEASDQTNASYSGADSSASKCYPLRSGSVKPTDNKPVYIPIPFLKMSGKIVDSTSIQTSDGSLSKLIDGYPRSISTSSPDIRIRKSYVMSYNKKINNAEWVYEILNKDTLKTNYKKNTRSFGKNEFEGNDYDQGHLAAVANHKWCQEAYHDTYLISNMVPQDTPLNRGMWSKLEQHCRDKITDKPKAKSPVVCNLHVYTGPLYLKKKNPKLSEDDYDRVDPREMEKGGKAVPTHFFKVTIAEKEDGTVERPICYLVPKLEKDDYDQNVTKVNNCTEHIERIQELSGLNFIESDPNVVMDHIKTIKWKGEGKTGESCSAVIKVRISSV